MSYSQTRIKNRGFTLVEMAIVLIIIGIVISAMITVLPSLIASAKARKTKAIMEKIDYSVRGYIGATHHLPCPDTDNDGWENRNDNALSGNPSDDTCASYVGKLPFLTLGMADGNDAWNNVPKFGVYQELIRTTGATGSNPLCTELAILINAPQTTTRLYSTSPGGINTNEAYIIASGGPKNLDGNGDGFFDGYNEGSDLQMDHPNRPPDYTTAGKQYDDLVTATSLNYIYGINCNGGGGVSGGSGASGTETNCTDGIDNDHDGYTDCADQDCQANPACVGNTAVQINTSALSATIIGNNYSHTFQATGGSGEFDWSLVSADIPGLTINRLTGVLSGDINVCSRTTPYNITVKVEDRADLSNSDNHTFGLNVNNGSLILTPTYETGDNSGTGTWVCDTSAWIRTITASGPALGDFNWGLTWGSPAPTGFAISKFSATEGHLQKTGSVAANTYNATITATDSQCSDNTISKNMTVEVTANGAGSPYSDGLAGEWRMDECAWNGTAGEVIDSSGAGNNATAVNNAFTTGSGRICRAASTDTGTAYLLLDPPLTLGASWTIAAWFRWPLAGTGTGWWTLTRGTQDHQILVNRSSNLLGTYDNHGTGFHSSGFNMSTLSSGWHHLAAVGHDSQTDFYIDGSKVGTASYKSTTDIKTLGNYIGGNQNWGEFDELMVWNRALTADDITTVYNLNRNTCSGACYTDPIGRYSMEGPTWDGTEGEVKDTGASPAENGVAAKTGSGALPAPTTPANGKVCRAASFSRTDGDYLDFGNVFSPGNKPWSMSAWFNWDGSSGENIISNKENLYEIRVNGGYLQYAWRPHWAWDGGTSFSVTANTWYHVTVVYDGHRQLLYKDGEQVYSRDESGAMGSNSSRFLIGARGSGNPRNFFGGRIDEALINDRALAVNEIAAIYNSSPTCPDNYPIITTAALADGTVGAVYSDTPAATGGTLNYAWDMGTSTVSGLTMANHSTGEISGTIGSCSGNYTVEVKLTDANGVTDSKLLPLTVKNGSLIVIPTAASLSCKANNSITCGQDFTASGPTVGSLTSWAIQWQGNDPGGFVLTGSGNNVTVSQTSASTAGLGYRFRLTAVDSTCPSNTLTTAWSTVDIQ
ncbi:MAG: LamG domain-containing protein [Deltaproteobacteria bacterium]|nr:LamG domain-containing protein [Deltaproteobacteria bacterium]